MKELTIEEIDQIPRNDLIQMLKDSVWYSSDREQFGKVQGYSLDVCEGTCYRDVLYRNEPLFDTPEQAIIEHWKRHYNSTH